MTSGPVTEDRSKRGEVVSDRQGCRTDEMEVREGG